jgi:hypothetical protein
MQVYNARLVTSLDLHCKKQFSLKILNLSQWQNRLD